MSINQQDQFAFKTKLTDGRVITITDNVALDINEYLITVDSESIYSNELPVLLRKKIARINIYSKIENRFVKTELNKSDTNIIQLLISNTPLNKFNVLFASIDLS